MSRVSPKSEGENKADAPRAILFLALEPSGAGVDGLLPATAIGWAEHDGAGGGDAGVIAANDTAALATRLAGAALVVVEDSLFDPPRLEVLLGRRLKDGAPLAIDWMSHLAAIGLAHRAPELMAAQPVCGADPLDRARRMRDLLVAAGALGQRDDTA